MRSSSCTILLTNNYSVQQFRGSMAHGKFYDVARHFMHDLSYINDLEWCVSVCHLSPSPPPPPIDQPRACAPCIPAACAYAAAPIKKWKYLMKLFSSTFTARNTLKVATRTKKGSSGTRQRNLPPMMVFCLTALRFRQWIKCKKQQQQIVESCHADKLGGHLGRDKTREKVASR